MKKTIELQSYYKEGVVEAGCDEAGRGCLAGAVFGAAVILPNDYKNPVLNDSKQVSEKKRLALREQIQKDALAWAVGIVDQREIDKINILNASILSMQQALSQLSIIPQHIIVDGNRFKSFKTIPHTCIIKGDSLYLSIAAASILAKTYRDEYMITIHKEFPHYGWNENKGYPTAFHREAVVKHGISPYHRLSFNLAQQLSFQFDL